jgi:hypothetical protein
LDSSYALPLQGRNTAKKAQKKKGKGKRPVAEEPDVPAANPSKDP